MAKQNKTLKDCTIIVYYVYILVYTENHGSPCNKPS